MWEVRNENPHSQQSYVNTTRLTSLQEWNNSQYQERTSPDKTTRYGNNPFLMKKIVLTDRHKIPSLNEFTLSEKQMLLKQNIRKKTSKEIISNPKKQFVKAFQNELEFIPIAENIEIFACGISSEVPKDADTPLSPVSNRMINDMEEDPKLVFAGIEL